MCMLVSEHVYMHMFLPLVVHIFIYSNMHMFIESRVVYTLVHAHTWTLMPTYIHMHMHTHVHAYAHKSKCTDMRSCKESDVFSNTMKSGTAVWGHSLGSFPKQLLL